MRWTKNPRGALHLESPFNGHLQHTNNTHSLGERKLPILIWRVQSLCWYFSTSFATSKHLVPLLYHSFLAHFLFLDQSTSPRPFLVEPAWPSTKVENLGGSLNPIAPMTSWSLGRSILKSNKRLDFRGSEFRASTTVELFFSYLAPQKVILSILPIHFTKHPAVVDLF